MAVTVGSGNGSFTISYVSDGTTSAEPWTEKFGYIKTNVLDPTATDTTAVASDLWNFAQQTTEIMSGLLSQVNVTYTAEIWGDD